MKTISLSKLVLVLSLFGFAAGSAATLHAADNKDKVAPAEKRAPLKLNVDRTPINRDSAERVSYAPIVKKTAASVVYVYSSKKVKRQDLTPYLNDPLFRRFFDVPEGRGGGGSGRGGNSSPKEPEQTQQGLGSGIVITDDGYILTNNHVIEGADDVKVAVGEASKRYTAKVVGRDPLADIAVLKIEATGLSPAVFGDSEQLQVGDVVLAIGNPFGLGQAVSRGIVSALGRGPGIEQFEDFIQTDAAINPGNSGGALIDSQGRVVGINTAILSSSGGFNGVGFAVPINLVRFVAEQIAATGRVDRGFLGIQTQEITEELSSPFQSEKGVIITEITSDSPADKAGLKPGDVVTKVNGSEIRDTRHLLLMVGQLAPETKVNIEYLRDGKTQTTTATLSRRTDDTVAQNDKAENKDVGVLNGVGVADITPEAREQLNVPARITGAIITQVEPDSPSARQGLREGDVILELDRRPVKDANEAVKLSEEIKGPKVMVTVWRRGRTSFVVVDESQK
jgi:serine protease Do